MYVSWTQLLNQGSGLAEEHEAWTEGAYCTEPLDCMTCMLCLDVFEISH